MKNYDLITPEGTKDLLFGECIIRRNIENTLLNLFKSRGYSEMITPGLEFFDVFNLKSRYFPQETLYKMTDSKGRLLVMRPDSTMPIARVVATRLRDAVLPLKLCYNQTVYRNESALKGRSDETVQTGMFQQFRQLACSFVVSQCRGHRVSADFEQDFCLSRCHK